MNYKDAAIAVAQANPPKSGRCLKPFAKFVRGLKKAGWEPGYLDLRIPASTIVGRRKMVSQPVAVFPESWVRELCKQAKILPSLVIELKIETEWQDAEFVQLIGGRPRNAEAVKEFLVRLPVEMADRILESTGEPTMSAAVKRLAEPIFSQKKTLIS